MVRTADSKAAFPSLDDLINLIRHMDPDEEEVVICLVKCHFDAKLQDVVALLDKLSIRAQGVVHYKPGSFSVRLAGRSKALNAVRSLAGLSLLDRPFYLKLGVRTQFHKKERKAIQQSS